MKRSSTNFSLWYSLPYLNQKFQIMKGIVLGKVGVSLDKVTAQVQSHGFRLNTSSVEGQVLIVDELLISSIGGHRMKHPLQKFVYSVKLIWNLHWFFAAGSAGLRVDKNHYVDNILAQTILMFMVFAVTSQERGSTDSRTTAVLHRSGFGGFVSWNVRHDLYKSIWISFSTSHNL